MIVFLQIFTSYRLIESWWKTQKALKCAPHWAAKLPTVGMPCLLQLWKLCLVGLQWLCIYWPDGNHSVVRTTWSGGLALFIAKTCVSLSLLGWAKLLWFCTPCPLCLKCPWPLFQLSKQRTRVQHQIPCKRGFTSFFIYCSLPTFFTTGSIKMSVTELCSQIDPHSQFLLHERSHREWLGPSRNYFAWGRLICAGHFWHRSREVKVSSSSCLVHCSQEACSWGEKSNFWSKETSQWAGDWSQWVHMNMSTCWCFYCS